MASRLLQTGINAGKALARVIDGKGSLFVLEDGRELIDASNTGGGLGHAHPEMVEAIREAATAPVINEGWLYTEREKAAQDVIDYAFKGEGDWVGAVRFFISGSEANDSALSLAQALTGRSSFATRERAFHGMVGLARDITVQPHWHGGVSSQRGGVSEPRTRASVKQLPAPQRAAYGEILDQRPTAERLAGIDEELADVAATIIDFTQGGIYYDAEYQDLIAAAARRAGSLYIADEVVTGLGRHGHNWMAFQGATSRPDMITLGKSLGGGASPAGAVVLSQELVDELSDKSWQTYSTLRAHPSLMAGIRAYLRIVDRDQLLKRTVDLGDVMRKRLTEVAEQHPSVRRVDGDGLHWTVELHGPSWRDWRGDTAETPIASQVAARAAEAGALIGTSGEQTSLFLAPAMTIPEEQLEGIFVALDHGLDVADQQAARQSDQESQ